MPNPNAIVAHVVRIDPPLDRPSSDERGFSIQLDNERTVRLDPADRASNGRARVLDGLRELRKPVYLEIDPATSVITRLLIPYVTRVQGIRPVDTGVLSIELERSHARHLLRASVPDASEIERALRDSLKSSTPIAVTETDAHEIIDARPFPIGPGQLPPIPRPHVPPFDPWTMEWVRYWLWRIFCWRCWPWRWFRCISMARAQQVFDSMSATSCAPLTVSPPCIPFMYPDDGCWARASEMCRLMIAMGLNPKKVWIQGILHAVTKNNPACFVGWNWHVAPTLCVRGKRFWQTLEMVIDPSLFTTPVSQAQWKGAQGDPNATLTATSASIFMLFGMSTDPAYTQTNIDLATYRMYLLNRSLGPDGPPPYANCP